MKRKQIAKWAKVTLDLELTFDERRLNKDLSNWEFVSVIEGLIKTNLSDISKREIITLFIENQMTFCEALTLIIKCIE